jgi:prenylcysteine alpha-carboxyl methylesterase
VTMANSRGLHYRLKQACEVVKHVYFMLRQLPWFIKLVLDYYILNTQLPGVMCVKNICYDKQHNKYLNLYLPSIGDNFKILVFVYGGGWNSGSPLIYHKLGGLLAKEMNMAVAVVGYTTHPRGDIMDMIRDVSTAIEWCFTSSKEYGVNTSEIHLFGHSAGAHITTMALLNQIPGVRRLINAQDMGPRNKDYKWCLRDIKSFVAATGVYDIVQHFDKETDRAIETFSGLAPSMHYTRTNFERFSPVYLIRAIINDENVAQQVRQQFPPILLVDVEHDTTVMGEKQTSVFLKCMKEELKHENVKHEFLRGFSHSDPVMAFTHNREEKSKVMLECLIASIK